MAYADLPNQFLRRRSTIAYFSMEAPTTGAPSDAYELPADTDAIVTVDPIDLNQALNFTDLNEVGTRLLNMQSVLNYGERTDASFQVISKVKDSASVTGNNASTGLPDLAPAEHFLLLQLMGDYSGTTYTTGGTRNLETVGGSPVVKNCVSYSFKDTPRTFQIAQLVNNTMLKCAHGSICSGGSLNISREGALTWEMNSRSAEISYSGAAAIDWAATIADGSNTIAGTTTDSTSQNVIDMTAGTTTVLVVHLDLPSGQAGDVFKVNDRVRIMDGSSNTTAGNVMEEYDSTNSWYMEVNAINGAAITLKNAYTCGTTGSVNFGKPNASTGVGFGDMSYLVPVLPEADLSAMPSEVIPQGNARIFLAPRLAGGLAPSVAQIFDENNGFLASDFTMTIDKNLGDPGVGELNGSMFPAPVYVAQDYSVSGTMSMVVRPKDIYRFQSFLRDYDMALGVKIEIPGLQNSAGQNRCVYLVFRSVRIAFEGSEMEGAEGSSISWMLTKGPSNITSDSELMEVIYT
jgi:hypothetical protein